MYFCLQKEKVANPYHQVSRHEWPEITAWMRLCMESPLSQNLGVSAPLEANHLWKTEAVYCTWLSSPSLSWILVGICQPDAWSFFESSAGCGCQPVQALRTHFRPLHLPSLSVVIDSSWNLFSTCFTLKIHPGFSLTIDISAAHFSSFHIVPHDSLYCSTFTAHPRFSRGSYSLQGDIWHSFVLMTTLFFLG